MIEFKKAGDLSHEQRENVVGRWGVLDLERYEYNFGKTEPAKPMARRVVKGLVLPNLPQIDHKTMAPFNGDRPPVDEFVNEGTEGTQRTKIEEVPLQIVAPVPRGVVELAPVDLIPPVMIRRSRLVRSLLNPRKHFDVAKLNELGLNLRENGVINSLVARVYRPSLASGRDEDIKFEIIAGERRDRASEARPHPSTGELMPEIEWLPVVVREISDAVALEMMLSENMQRRDLTELEECDGFYDALQLKDADGNPLYTQEKLAQKIGVSQQVISDRLSLRNLPKEGRKALEAGKISYRAARVVAGCHESIIEKFTDVVLHPGKHRVEIPDVGYATEPLTSDQARYVLDARFVKSLAGVPFALEDGALMPVHRSAGGERINGGACVDCPWYGGNRAVGDGEEAKRGAGRPRGDARKCYNPSCLAAKLEIYSSVALVQAKEEGCEVLSREESAQVFHDGALAFDSGYIDLEDYPDAKEQAKNAGKVPTWGVIIEGEVKVPVVVAVDDKGHVRRLAKRSLALEAVSANKTGLQFLNLSSGIAGSVQEKDAAVAQDRQNDDTRMRNEVAFAVVEAVVDKIRMGSIPELFYDWLMDLAAHHASKDGALFMVKRRGEASSIDEDAAVEDYMNACETFPQKLAMVAELLIAREVKFKGAGQEYLQALCKIFKVNALRIEKLVRKGVTTKDTKGTKVIDVPEEMKTPPPNFFEAMKNAADADAGRNIIKNHASLIGDLMASMGMIPLCGWINAKDYRGFETVTDKEWSDAQDRADLIDKNKSVMLGNFIWQGKEMRAVFNKLLDFERPSAPPKKKPKVKTSAAKKPALTSEQRAKIIAKQKKRWAEQAKKKKASTTKDTKTTKAKKGVRK